jgi:hypothetical protein
MITQVFILFDFEGTKVMTQVFFAIAYNVKIIIARIHKVSCVHTYRAFKAPDCIRKVFSVCGVDEHLRSNKSTVCIRHMHTPLRKLRKKKHMMKTSLQVSHTVA